jgi:hypothetical protein
MVEKDEKPIRVVDRRMFTPDGELRPDFEPEEPASPPPPPPPPAASAAASAGSSSPSPSSQSPSLSASPTPPTASPQQDASGRAAADEDAGEGEEAGPPPSSEPRSEFTAIVRSLATTAYSALGLLPDPSGARHRPEPAVARQMIDWLTVLESKTRNNLSFEESDFLSRVLYELRMAFVEVMGQGGGGPGRSRPPGR